MNRPTLLFAPGAGAGSDSGWMTAWTERLDAIGRVQPFDYHYRLEGRRAPDRLPKLIARHHEVLEQLAPASTTETLVLAGKSMGSRVGCHLAVERGGAADRVAGLVCFGYPLKSAGKSGAIRDEVLLSLGTPILFIQGTRDPMGPLDLFDAVRKRMTARSTLHVVDGGDHSLRCGKRALAAAGQTQEEVNARILEAVRAFVTTL